MTRSNLWSSTARPKGSTTRRRTFPPRFVACLLSAPFPLLSLAHSFSASKILKATDNAGVNVVIDFVGQNYWEKNVASLGRDGRMVLLGLMSGAVTEKSLNMGPILFKRLRIEGEWSFFLKRRASVCADAYAE
jgi:NADPH:quinone reductase-like Zn-dependent oxidoreductase